MLDDLQYIHEKDVVGTLNLAAGQWKQLLEEFTPTITPEFGQIDNVVFAGMGGSALAAEIVKDGLSVPFQIVRNYDLPAYVGKNTLFVASSYSGNTEETIEALAKAEEKGAQIVVIAAGGKLQQIAAEKNLPFYLLPVVDQPRYAVFYSFKATLTILASAGLMQMDEIKQQLDDAVSFLQETVKQWAPEVPTDKNPAKQLAQELLGKSMVVYAGPKMWPAAYKWKISCNENAKQIAWTNQIPEFNHNEFIGWSKQPTDKPYVVVDLRSHLEHPRVQKRFEVTARLLSGMRPEPHVVTIQGDTITKQILWAITYGDFVTLYLALLNGLNPAPVDLVERFKKALDE